MDTFFVSEAFPDEAVSLLKRILGPKSCVLTDGSNTRETSQSHEEV